MPAASAGIGQSEYFPCVQRARSSEATAGTHARVAASSAIPKSDVIHVWLLDLFELRVFEALEGLPRGRPLAPALWAEVSVLIS